MGHSRLLVGIVAAVALGSAAARASDEPVGGSSAIREITHRRTGCFGQCPVYSLTVRADGQALFRGDRNVTPIGQLTGVIPQEEFARLVALAEAARFFELRDGYDQAITDLPYCYTQLTQGAKKKEVVSRCEALSAITGEAPGSLLQLEGALDALRQKISWKRDAAPRKAAEQ